MRVLKNIRYYGETTAIAVVTFLMGLYIRFHVNYLDDPRVTPTPFLPPPDYRELLGFADDWWFATLLIIVSLVLLLGVLLDSIKLIKPTISVLSSIYLVLALEFSARGMLEPHFNISWAGCLIAVIAILNIMFKLGRGGDRHP
ncbi:hypothetical protein [Nicoliella lavandulae]|uniref:Uncharacterized protein n=1 Tax=Nicoliella lavandulae TaxID=3082954 RepID=A0ABU8SMC9_9LACO